MHVRARARSAHTQDISSVVIDVAEAALTRTLEELARDR